MQWAASYIGSTWALVSVVGLSVASLGTVAFFARNWKVAVAAALILAAGFTYMQVDKNAYQRRVSEESAARVKTLESRLATLQKQTKADAERAKADADYIEALEIAASETPPNATPGIPADVAKRIGAIR